MRSTSNSSDNSSWCIRNHQKLLVEDTVQYHYCLFAGMVHLPHYNFPLSKKRCLLVGFSAALFVCGVYEYYYANPLGHFPALHLHRLYLFHPKESKSLPPTLPASAQVVVKIPCMLQPPYIHDSVAYSIRAAPHGAGQVDGEVGPTQHSEAAECGDLHCAPPPHIVSLHSRFGDSPR